MAGLSLFPLPDAGSHDQALGPRPTHCDLNWHWYGPDGYRVMTHVRAGVATPYGLSYDVGPRTYYFNDGADVTLTVRRESAAGPYKVFQRYLTGGVDQQLAARLNGVSATRSLAVVGDIQGSTIKLLRDDLTPVECDPTLTFRGPFGTVVTAQAGCGESAETGYAGASTPNSNGGYTYLRNRWYDPQTSRFLTQDPIGLAGGVNLYAYAGGNPVAYRDPFGLCEPKPWCWAQESADFWAAQSNNTTGIAKFGADLAGGLATLVSDEETATLTAAVLLTALGVSAALEGAGQEQDDGAAAPSCACTGNSPTNAPGQTSGGRATDSQGRPLGPSGKPMIHQVDHSTRKDAKDAARNAGQGAPMHHPSPQRGGPHFHPVDEKGRKISDGTHYNYPP